MVNFSQAHQAQAIGALQQYPSSANALAQPREVRILERVEGLRAGLGSLVSRLESFSDRVAGAATGDDAKPEPAVCGLTDTLARAEECLRRAHVLITTLDEAF